MSISTQTTLAAVAVGAIMGTGYSQDESEQQPRLTDRQIAEVLKLKPIGYWPANEGEGDLLYDASPNNNHASLHNVEWNGNLLYFRGLFQWAEIPASTNYMSRTFSMGGWVFLRSQVKGGWNNRNQGFGMTFLGNGYHTSSYSLDTLNQDEVLFLKSSWKANGGCEQGASIRLRRGQRIDMLSNGRDDVIKTADREDLLAVGRWQHILYTYESPAKIEGDKGWVDLQDTSHYHNAGTARVYLNGTLVQSANRVSFKPRMAPFLVGSDAAWWLQASSSGSLDGSVRDLVIFDRALNPDEVAALHNNTVPNEKPQMLTTNTLLPRAGNKEAVNALAPEYLATFQDTTLSKEERADALLAWTACKTIDTHAVLECVVNELKQQPAQLLEVEDYYRNALISTVYIIDPDNDILKTVVQVPEGNYFSQGDTMRDNRPAHSNRRAYTSSYMHQGRTYRCGKGIAFDGVEAVSDDEFEHIAKAEEETYPGIRRWAEGKDLARVTINVSNEQGGEHKYYPLGKTFIFDQTDAKIRGWSIAVDKQGYIHLMGGMHNAPNEENFMPGSWESWGMSRDLKSDKYPTLPYWVSMNPGDASSFVFVGHRDNPRNLPLVLGLNYMNFVQDRESELYLYGRIHVQGLQSWGMYRYDVASRSWSSLGGFAPDVKREFPVWSDRFIAMAADGLALASIRWKYDHPKSKVLVWSRQPHFYNFIRGWSMRWDHNNRLHLQVPIFALDSNNRTFQADIYAYSDDGGQTFHSADGKRVSLPLGATPGPNNANVRTPANLKRWNLWVSLLKNTNSNCGLRQFSSGIASFF